MSKRKQRRIRSKSRKPNFPPDCRTLGSLSQQNIERLFDFLTEGRPALKAIILLWYKHASAHDGYLSVKDCLNYMETPSTATGLKLLQDRTWQSYRRLTTTLKTTTRKAKDHSDDYSIVFRQRSGARGLFLVSKDKSLPSVFWPNGENEAPFCLETLKKLEDSQRAQRAEKVNVPESTFFARETPEEPLGDVREIRWTPDGRLLLILTSDSELRFFNPETGCLDMSDYCADKICCRPGSNELLLYSVVSGNSIARLVEFERGEELLSIDLQRTAALDIDYSYCGAYIFTLCDQGFLTVRDANNGVTIEQYKAIDKEIRMCSHLSIHPIKDALVLNGWLRKHYYFSGVVEGVKYDIPVDSFAYAQILDIGANPEGAVVSCPTEKILRVSDDQWCISFDNIRQEIIFGSQRGEKSAFAIRKDSLRTFSPRQSLLEYCTWEIYCRYGYIHDVDHCEINDLFAIASDNMVLLRKVANRRGVSEDIKHEGRVRKASFDRKGKYLATLSGGNRDVVQLWDANTESKTFARRIYKLE